MKVTLILALVALVGLSSAYSLGDVYEKLHRVEERDISLSTGSFSVESREKRDISGMSTGTSSLESREKRDISLSTGSFSVESREKRDISGMSTGTSSLESREKR
ncbi:uncharacterized protein LOC122243241, partial [Penaeus japonicus]|uniref:uncharacterized protein LOC122243241 n=1 Tax=Penaeus japonicus TaxID=27405 RepID=UPI001C71622C